MHRLTWGALLLLADASPRGATIYPGRYCRDRRHQRLPASIPGKKSTWHIPCFRIT